jgi:hypothetical protein
MVSARIGVIMVGLGLLILLVGFYFFDAAGDVVTPEDVIWGLGRLFRDIDRSDIRLLEKIGIAGVAIGGVLFLGGLILMIRRGQ